MAKGKGEPPPRILPLRAPGKLGDELSLADDEPRTSVGQSPFAPDEFVDDLITNPGAPAALADEVARPSDPDPFEDLTPPPSIPAPARAASTGGSLVLPLPAAPGAPAVVDRPPRLEGFVAPGKAPFQDAAQRLSAAGAAKIAGAKKHRIVAVAEAGPDWTWARLREIAIGVLLIGLVASAFWVDRARPVAKERPKVLLLDEASRPLVVRSWKDLYLAQQSAASSTVSGAEPLEGVRTLSVFSVPGGAQVFVDRVYRGVTPLVLPGGRSVVEVRVQLNGFTTWTGMVSPDDNGHATVNAVLTRR